MKQLYGHSANADTPNGVNFHPHYPVKIPASLDLTGVKTVHKDKYKYFLGTLAKNSMATNGTPFGWVSMDVRLLRDYLGATYSYKRKDGTKVKGDRATEIRQELLESGLIEWNTDYSFYRDDNNRKRKDGECMKYRIKETELKWTTITDRRILKKLNKSAHEHLKELLKTDIYGYQFYCLSEVTFDAEKARQKLSKYIDEGYDKDTIETLDAKIKELESISNRKAGDMVDARRMSRDKGGRLHTNITNVSSKFREFIKIQGEELTVLDIGNSYPYFMAEWLNKKLNQHICPSLLSPFLSSSSSMLIKNEISQLQRDTEQKCFYDKITPAKYANLDRTEFKRRFYRQFLFSQVDPKNTVIGKKIGEVYPMLLEVVSKSSGGDYWYKELTRLESSYIDAVSRVLMNRQILYLTLYDGLIVKKSEVDEVRKVMEGVAMEMFQRPMPIAEKEIKECSVV